MTLLAAPGARVTDFDVIIVGAGLSGIGAACRLKAECPDHTFTVLEGRDSLGGTWDLFRYPGVRSDSDMFTLGYAFNPWKAPKAIADGTTILEYVRETAAKFGVDASIRYRHRVTAARWSSETATWTLELEVGPEREPRQLTCRFLHLCCGYYDYEKPHDPKIPGRERFRGRFLHPQHWPAGVDCAGQRVVVVGSGATAITVVPALAETASHVTMLQRSPTYIAAVPDRDAVADFLRAVLPAALAHHAVRIKNVLLMIFLYAFSRAAPQLTARLMIGGVTRLLPKGYPVAKHFAPRYAPWDQRVCVAPNGDIFAAIRDGRVEVVTDTIATFTEAGVLLDSGRELEADVIVTATGFTVVPIGGILLDVDGRSVRPRDAVVYRGMMLADVPNLTWCVGYTNAAWTLKVDLSSRYVCRLLKHMRELDYDIATPRGSTAGTERRPLFDFAPGYVTRAADVIPQQGARPPWFTRQNYVLDAFAANFDDLDDGAMAFTTARVREAPP